MTLIVTCIDELLFIESTEGKFQRKFPGKIAEYHIVENRVLVRLEFGPGAGARNIFCLNERADLLWQIQDPNSLSAERTVQSDSSFIGIMVGPEKLKAINWDSNSYDVDINTGKLSNPRWTK